MNNTDGNSNPQHSSTNHLNNQYSNLNHHSSTNNLNNQYSNLNNQQINQIQQQPETQNHPPAHHANGLNDGNPLNTSSCNANNQQKVTTYENINKTKIVKIQNVPNLDDSTLREHIVIIIPPTNIELMWNKKTFLNDQPVYYPIQYLDSVKINIERQDGSYMVKITHFPKSKSELLRVYNKLDPEFPGLEAKKEMNKKTAHNSVTPCLALLDGDQFIGKIIVDWWRKNQKSSNTRVHLETLEDKDDREMEILLKHCNGMDRESFAKLRKEKIYNVFSFMDEFSLSSMLGKIQARYQELAKRIQSNLTNVNRIVWYSQEKNGVYVLLSCAVPGGWCYTESDYPPNILPPQIKFDTGSSNKKRKVGEGCHKLQVPPNLDVYVNDTDVDEAFYKQYETNHVHCGHIFSKGGLEEDAKFLMHWNYKSATVGWDEWKEVINTEAFKRENKATLTYYIGGLMKTETVEVRELVQRKKGERKGEEMEEEKEEEDEDENTGGEEDKGEEEKEEKKREEEVQQCFDGFSGSSSGYKTAKCVFWIVDCSSESEEEEEEEAISGEEEGESKCLGETASPSGVNSELILVLKTIVSEEGRNEEEGKREQGAVAEGFNNRDDITQTSDKREHLEGSNESSDRRCNEEAVINDCSGRDKTTDTDKDTKLGNHVDEDDSSNKPKLSGKLEDVGWTNGKRKRENETTEYETDQVKDGTSKEPSPKTSKSKTKPSSPPPPKTEKTPENKSSLVQVESDILTQLKAEDNDKIFHLPVSIVYSEHLNLSEFKKDLDLTFNNGKIFNKGTIWKTEAVRLHQVSEKLLKSKNEHLDVQFRLQEGCGRGSSMSKMTGRDEGMGDLSTMMEGTEYKDFGSFGNSGVDNLGNNSASEMYNLNQKPVTDVTKENSTVTTKTLAVLPHLIDLTLPERMFIIIPKTKIKLFWEERSSCTIWKYAIRFKNCYRPRGLKNQEEF